MSFIVEIDGQRIGGSFISLAAAKRFAQKQTAEETVEFYEEKPNGLLRIDGWEVKA
nr:MAG TPA: hypothetical protein [Caudoviricetes sp.]